MFTILNEFEEQYKLSKRRVKLKSIFVEKRDSSCGKVYQVDNEEFECILLTLSLFFKSDYRVGVLNGTETEWLCPSRIREIIKQDITYNIARCVVRHDILTYDYLIAGRVEMTKRLLWDNIQYLLEATIDEKKDIRFDFY